MSSFARGLLLVAAAAVLTLSHLAGQTSDRRWLLDRWSPSLSLALGCVLALAFTAVALSWRWRRWQPRPIRPVLAAAALAVVVLVAVSVDLPVRSSRVVDDLRILVVATTALLWIGVYRPRWLLKVWSRQATIRAAAIACGFVLAAAVVEVASRGLGLLAPSGSPVVRYLPHPYLAYAPRPETFEEPLARFWRGADPAPAPPGTLRVVAFGGSTTEEGWPGDLEQLLNERLTGCADVLNAGVASYTSAENFATLAFRGLAARPDIVVLEHGVNDVRPRVYPEYRPDFAHYRHPWRVTPAERARGWLEGGARHSHFLRLVARRLAPFQSLEHVTTWPGGQELDRLDEPLAAGTSQGFERNTRNFVRLARASGALVVLVTEPYNDSAQWRRTAPRYVVHGVPEHNAIIARIAAEEGAVLADAAAALAGQPDLFVDVVHTTPEGRRRKAATVGDAIASLGF